VIFGFAKSKLFGKKASYLPRISVFNLLDRKDFDETYDE